MRSALVRKTELVGPSLRRAAQLHEKDGRAEHLIDRQEMVGAAERIDRLDPVTPEYLQAQTILVVEFGRIDGLDCREVLALHGPVEAGFDGLVEAFGRRRDGRCRNQQEGVRETGCTTPRA